MLRGKSLPLFRASNSEIDDMDRAASPFGSDNQWSLAGKIRGDILVVSLPLVSGLRATLARRHAVFGTMENILPSIKEIVSFCAMNSKWPGFGLASRELTVRLIHAPFLNRTTALASSSFASSFHLVWGSPKPLVGEARNFNDLRVDQLSAYSSK